MMEVDIYDFDKTIVPFDSGTLFCVYCFIHYPYLILLLPIALPIIGISFVLLLMKLISFTSVKKICFMFVPFIPLKRAVKGFWDKHIDEVHPWFIKEKNRYRVIISASPDFLLADINERLGFDKLICTRHNRKTGAILGENCRGEEKVRRLYEEFDKNDIKVIDVYSDSLFHDKAIFSLATENCYHIVDGERQLFNFSEVYKD